MGKLLRALENFRDSLYYVRETVVDIFTKNKEERTPLSESPSSPEGAGSFDETAAFL
jgi:hypothetical protein